MDKPKRGRPKKFVDLELVEKLAHIQCTYAEIASTLGISVDTLERHKDFAATFKRGAEGGRKSLRRMQFESANKGNVVMQIWLGKQYLDQSDRMKSESRVIRSWSDISTEELRELINQGPTIDVNYSAVRDSGNVLAPAALVEATVKLDGASDTGDQAKPPFNISSD